MDAHEFWSWLGFWVQLAVLAFLAICGLYFGSQGGEPGDDTIGLILAAAAVILAALLVKRQFDGDAGGWFSLLLVDNMPSLIAAIALLTILGLAGLIVGGTHDSASVQDGGLALFIVCVLLVFLSIKRFFDMQEAHN